jgi:hypothetical protein
MRKTAPDSLRADSIRAMRPQNQAGEGGSIPTSALQLWIERIDTELALSLNAEWHSSLPRLGRGAVRIPYLSYAARGHGRIVAVGIWSNPVARLLPQQEWLELRRLAIGPDAPRFTGSRMLSVMARLIRRSLPRIKALISYHDTSVHCGAIYRAAGWQMDAVTRGKDWRNASRPNRPPAVSVAPKVRWIKYLSH